MNKWLDNALADAETVNDWLSPKRKISLELLKHAEWPNRKLEAWKYTPVRALESAHVSRVIDAEKTLAAKNDDNIDTQADTFEILNVNFIDAMFVNGQLKKIPATSTLPNGLSVKSFSELNESEEAVVFAHFSTIKPARHVFGLVNDVLATNGIFIDVTAQAIIENPVRLLNIMTEGCEAHARVFVRVGAGASVTVIEQFSGNAQSVNTSFSEYQLNESAKLEHYRFAMQTDRAITFGGNHFYLSEKAYLNSTIIGFGSELSRLDVDVIHGGEFALAKINAIYLLKDKELFDLHSTIEHAAPNGTTEENVRGIVADQSKAVFNGRIHIHRHAQKTLAELNNRNLLLSDKAEINTKPELEIYADDVKCAHGATIAEVDKGALYYLQSRGIGLEQAKIMLNFGFINELVDMIPNQAVAEWVRPQLRHRFSLMQ